MTEARESTFGRLDNGSFRTDIVFVQTTDVSVRSQLQGQLGFLRSQGLRVAVASADSGDLRTVASEDGVAAYALPIKRDPSLLADVRALFAVIQLLRTLRPRIVVYGTPKAALLGAVASWMLRVPRRIYCVYGLRLETMSGYSRALMLVVEKALVKMSTDVIAVGNGLRKEMAAAGITGRVTVFGRGSANGVDVASYELSGKDESLREKFRTEQGIPHEAVVVGYVGRITADKGIDALVSAMHRVREEFHDVYLLLVGPEEALGSLTTATLSGLDENWVRRSGNVQDTSTVYGAIDVFCLPSRREGLPTVLLEAAASGTPIVATEATGVRDVIPDSRYGLIVPIDDVENLAEALLVALRNSEESHRMAGRAQRLVRQEFDRQHLWDMQHSFYSKDDL